MVRTSNNGKVEETTEQRAGSLDLLRAPHRFLDCSLLTVGNAGLAAVDSGYRVLTGDIDVRNEEFSWTTKQLGSLLSIGTVVRTPDGSELTLPIHSSAVHQELRGSANLNQLAKAVCVALTSFENTLAELPRGVLGASTYIGLPRNKTQRANPNGAVNEDAFFSVTNVTNARSVFGVVDGIASCDRGDLGGAAAAHSLVNLTQLGHGLKKSLERVSYSMRGFTSEPFIQGCGAPIESGADYFGCVATAQIERDVLTIGHLGDVRAFLARRREDGSYCVGCITRDHNRIATLADRVDRGEISEESFEAAKCFYQNPPVDRFVGVRGDRTVIECQPELSYPIELNSGDCVLIASDGFWGNVRETDLSAALQAATSMQRLTDKLFDLAYSRMTSPYGRVDNMTFVAYRHTSNGAQFPLVDGTATNCV